MSAPTTRVIAVEEHAWTPELRSALVDSGDDDTVTWFSNSGIISHRLLDVDEERVARMDAAGVDLQVLSITTPGTQSLPSALAVPLARDANDFLFDAVQRRPDRFAAFATLPTPDPDAAAVELRRCIHELGFVGAMLFPRTGPTCLITTVSGRFLKPPPSSGHPSTCIPAYRRRRYGRRATTVSTSPHL